MAKGKFQEWLTDEGLTLLEGWARKGYRDRDIADRIGISVSTLYEWKNKYKEFSDALKKGKEVIDFEVENKLLELALEGNITAIIFWLKNRMPEDWRDKPRDKEADQDGETGVVLLPEIGGVSKCPM